MDLPMRGGRSMTDVEATNAYRASIGLPPAIPIPQWFIDQQIWDAGDQTMAEWLTESGPGWARIAETHMRCLGHIDRSLRKALRHGWINPRGLPHNRPA
jgi:hypothetical protein